MERLGVRDISRIIAFLCLYAYDIVHPALSELLNLNWYLECVSFDDEEGLLFAIPSDYLSEVVSFTAELVNGVVSRLEYVDRVIEEHLVNWKFERLHLVDKAILRIGVYSLIYRFDIPSEVTIYEANQLATEYSDYNSYNYINGILHNVKNKYRRNFILDQILSKHTKAKKKIKIKNTGTQDERISETL